MLLHSCGKDEKIGVYYANMLPFQYLWATLKRESEEITYMY